MIGYLVYNGIFICIDVFSNKTGSLKAGELRILDNNKPLKQQIYESLSGNKWDETMEKLDKSLMEEE